MIYIYRFYRTATSSDQESFNSSCLYVLFVCFAAVVVLLLLLLLLPGAVFSIRNYRNIYHQWLKTFFLLEKGEWLRTQCCIHFPPNHFKYLFWSYLLIFTSDLHSSYHPMFWALLPLESAYFLRIWMFQLRRTPRKYC